MTRVGIKELSDRTSEIARLVREDHETIELTYHGEVFARIVPTIPGETELSFEERWERRRQLAEEIAKRWIGEPDAVAAIREQRRNLTPDEWVKTDWRSDE